MLSFWEKNTFLNYDVIIVGSGILGLSTACELKERYPEKDILVLERGIFPTGASTKNAGFLCFGSLTEILADIALKGEENAVKLVEKRWQGISFLKQRISENKMGYLNYGGYELIDEKSQAAIEKIEYVNSLLLSIIGENVFVLKNDDIRNFGFDEKLVKSLVFSRFESQIDTGLMMKTLMKYAEFLGIQIINGAEVIDFRKSQVIVKHQYLNEDVTFNSETIISCANAFSWKLFPEMNVKPGRGQVIVTKPISGLKLKGIFHYDEGYYYFRNYGQRVIFGGGRNLDFAAEETAEFGLNKMITDDLISKLDNMILPGTSYEIEDMWSGIMGFTNDKLPEIKVVGSDVVAAICCNGMGIALSSYIAKEIVNFIS